MKSLLTGVAAAAAIGAAVAGGADRAYDTAPQVQLTVFGIPLPLDPASAVPTADQLVGVLNGVADPHVPASNKSGLVEGGLGPIERSVMDGRMRKGLENGKLPLTISASNIEPDGPGAATADITASSAKLSPRTINLKFVDQDGWKLSHQSLMMLSQLSAN
ncbi:hypothetical protein KIH27_05805 [Mycobacterium sp. M1]|uniref:Low molecular weight antigen MTB12-like C-terminal domain-containing protein n=1 Tax=Mycolicibacter acidiphilus TaxID=2835306 RepID=A0ABS5RFS0_9MYCO|nr:hypothetical protein [Mycolicibacter acidiphilus]MBS9533103.1 hypothetical protein [Mycolicibacter acidiphilus]